MSQRERLLVIVLFTLFVVVGGGFGGYLFLFGPLLQLWDESRSLEMELLEKEEELTRKKQQIANIEKTSPRLAAWRKISLPPRDPEAKKTGVSPEEQKKRHVAQLQIEYERYLSELMRRSGFSSESINITARPPAPAANTPRGKTPILERLGFVVTGKTKLEGLVQMMHDFHRTNLLHQIRNLSVTATQNRSAGRSPTPTGEIDLNMTVEALIVNGGEARSALMPSAVDPKAKVLADSIRSYREMSGKHMFLGVAAPPSRISEDKIDVLRFVRLTTLSSNGRRWEGYFYDQAKGGEERRVNTLVLDDFEVLDKYDNTVLSAKVVHVDERQLILKDRVEGKFIRLTIGDFLYPAIETPLTPKELSELGLSPGS